ncbi:MAG TPA: putative Ig domain-containing protein, partial [Verrucomicrobiae bacterium]|nr:putative Ig domain-containing protein [Verrucomicrobiae bacterium]
LTNTATDSDVPANSLTYTLLNAPAGMNIDSNGIVTWTPTEAQGPVTNTVTAVVTDNNPWAVNSQHLSVTNTFQVVVFESNSPPVLPVIGPQAINELATLRVTNTATDPDIPANSLTYQLLNPPAGVQIDSNGIISWTPTEAQGPSTNVVVTVVTDNNPWALNAQHLSATNSFTLVVNEVNTKPVLQPIADTSTHYGLPISVQAVASDADIPTNTLTFSLDAAPTNMTINAASGLISWTPALEQIGSATVTVRVTDNGLPPLSDTTSFHVTVTGSQPQLGIQSLPGRLVQINITGDVGTAYELQVSTNLVNWDNYVPITPTASPYPYIDPGSSTAPTRFYRLKVGTP